jgi:hypothetical protein
MTKEYGLTITVLTPTRVTNNTSSTIDNIITNVDPLEYTVSVVNTAIADHYGQVMELSKERAAKNDKRWIVLS